MGVYGKYPMKAKGIGRVVIAGGFVTVASSNPTVLYGTGFSVVRDAAGRYTVTLDQKVNAIESITATGCPETVANPTIVMVDQDTITQQVFELRMMQESGGALALADDAGSIVYFNVIVRDSNVDL